MNPIIEIEKAKQSKVWEKINRASMQNTAIALLESASAFERAVLECEHLEASEHGGFRWERWRGSGMEERGPPEVPLIVTPPCAGGGGGGGGGAALTTSRRAASARGSRDDLPPSTWRSSVRVRDTGFRGSRKSIVRLEPPCNGLNGLPAIGKEVMQLISLRVILNVAKRVSTSLPTSTQLK